MKGQKGLIMQIPFFDTVGRHRKALAKLTAQRAELQAKWDSVVAGGGEGLEEWGQLGAIDSEIRRVGAAVDAAERAAAADVKREQEKEQQRRLKALQALQEKYGQFIEKFDLLINDDAVRAWQAIEQVRTEIGAAAALAGVDLASAGAFSLLEVYGRVFLRFMQSTERSMPRASLSVANHRECARFIRSQDSKEGAGMSSTWLFLLRVAEGVPITALVSGPPLSNVDPSADTAVTFSKGIAKPNGSGFGTGFRSNFLSRAESLKAVLPPRAVLYGGRKLEAQGAIARPWEYAKGTSEVNLSADYCAGPALPGLGVPYISIPDYLMYLCGVPHTPGDIRATRRDGYSIASVSAMWELGFIIDGDRFFAQAMEPATALQRLVDAVAPDLPV